MASTDRAQGSRSRTSRNTDKVSAESHEGNSRQQGRRSSQSEDLGVKVGCLDCKRILGPKSKSVECDNCNNWICMACSGLSDAKFDVISEDQSDMIWFCRHCRIALPGMKNILKSISQLDRSHTALMGRHDELERRVEVLEKAKPEDSSPTTTNAIKEEVQEAIQRERRKMALIVRGIPENGKDREEIHHILATLEMTDEFNQTPQPTRLGKQNERGTSRPIKIECETTEQKFMLLKRSKTLARHESTREVYIGPDLTRKERLAGRVLRDELKTRRARGEEHIFIRRNEIVTAPPLLVAPPSIAAPQAAAPVAQAAAPQVAAPVAQAAAPQAAAPVAQAAVPAPKN